MNYVFLILLTLAVPAQAQPVNVSRVHGTKIFHQLEASGRKNIALSGDFVAIVWNDNRNGSSQTYVALKKRADSKFAKDRILSAGKEAIEAGLVGVGDGRFVAAWEQDGKIVASAFSAERMQKTSLLSAAQARQVALAFGPQGLYATWIEQAGRFGRVVVAQLTLTDTAISVKRKISVESGSPRDEQLYPSIALNAGGVTLVWEDRRGGYTGIFKSHSADFQTFAVPRQLNDIIAGGRSQGLGRGSGAMRPALASMAGKGVAAVWSDKRDFLSGYDVYGALSQDGGAHFGANEKIQDSFGDSIAQWHPAVAANAAGKLVVAFDDERDGTPDVWVSWRGENGWGDNIAVDGAAGAGSQSSPAIALDELGVLHVTWTERKSDGGGSRIRYTRVK